MKRSYLDGERIGNQSGLGEGQFARGGSDAAGKGRDTSRHRAGGEQVEEARPTPSGLEVWRFVGRRGGRKRRRADDKNADERRAERPVVDVERRKRKADRQRREKVRQ